MLLRIFGTTVYASAAVMGAFMAGLAIGSFLVGRYLPNRIRQNTFLYYGLLELLIAGCGLAPFALDNSIGELLSAFFESAVGGNDTLSYFLRLIAGTIVLLLPCAAMGATYPLLSRFLQTLTPKPTFAFLYSANCLGAMAGCISSGFLLLPLLGIRKTCFIGSAIDLIIFAAAFAANGWMKGGAIKPEPQETPAPMVTTSTPLLTLKTAVYLSFSAGFYSIILELIFIRFFSTLFGSCIYSMSIVLATVLAAMALGAIAVRTSKLTTQQMLISTFILTALSLLIPLALAPFSSSFYSTVNSFLATMWLCTDPFQRSLLTRELMAVFYIFPAMFFACSILPAIASTIEIETEIGTKDKTSCVATVYAANCVGAIAGAAAGGFILIPFFMSVFPSGMEATIKVVFSLSVLNAAYLVLPTKPKQKDKILFGTLCVIGAFIWLVPSFWLSPQILKSRAIDFYEEGLNSTVTLVKSRPSNLVILQNDGKTEATLPYDWTRLCPESDFSTHVLLAELPILLHKNPVKKALLIGLGTGTTAEAFLEHPSVSDLLVAELEPAIAAAYRNRCQFGYTPKFHLRINDARYLLSSHKDYYDVIASQPADPWVNGSADLYTKEFWTLTKQHLADGGIFCQWLQLYAMPADLLNSLIATFQSIYPQTVICHAPGAGEIILLGFKNNGRFSSSAIKEKIAAVYRASSEKNRFSSLEKIGISTPEDLLAVLKIAPRFSKQALSKENTDDHPYSEFVTGRAILAGTSSLKDNLQMILEEQNIALDTLDEDWQNNAQGARQLARWARARALNTGSLGDKINKSVLNLATKAIQKYPCPETYWCRALVETETGNKSAASIDTKEALSCPAETAADYVCLLDINLTTENLFAAERLYESASSKYPKSESIYDRGAWLALAQNKPELAWQRFDRAQAIASPSLLSYLGRFYAGSRLGKTQQAQEALTRYLIGNPWNSNAHLLYSLGLADEHRFKDAWDQALDCNRLNPEDCRAFYLVLSACIDAKETKQAGSFLKTLPSHLAEDSVLQQVSILLQEPDTPDRLAKQNKYSALIKQIKEDAKNPKYGYNLFGFP